MPRYTRADDISRAHILGSWPDLQLVVAAMEKKRRRGLSAKLLFTKMRMSFPRKKRRSRRKKNKTMMVMMRAIWRWIRKRKRLGVRRS